MSRKLPGLPCEHEAARSAALRGIAWLEKVHGALSLDPNLLEAHALLADHYRERLIEAELAHRDEDAARFEVLRAHARGRHAPVLRGDGTLALVTDPPGAEVWLKGHAARGRRLVAEPLRPLGPAPLRAVPLQ